MAVRGDESGRGAHNHDVKEHRPFSGRVLLIAVVALLAALTGVHVLGTGADGRSPAAAESHPTLAAESSSGVVRLEVIGYSAQHRPIVARELGDPHATYRAVVLGSIHGFYERAGETVSRAMRTMTIPVGIQLWVIDTINPDGDALQQRGNAHGVDLNRNWPYSWIPISRSGCTPFVCHYSGPHALSEPESVAMRTFLTRIKPQRVVSIHQPLDGVDTTDGGAKDPAFRNALARNLNLPLRAFTCYGGCHGTLTGWLTHSTTTTGITVELPQTVASSYLTGTAARGILSALMVGVHVPARPAVSRVVGAAGAAGPSAGGNTVTIDGSGFTTGWRVTFGGVPGTRLKVISTHRITVVAPRHSAGLVSVRVTGVGGTSSTTTKARYTYLAPPTIRTVTGTSHATGPTAGGNTVTITGTGFTTITRVTFGSTRATAVRRLSTIRLTAVAPRHTAGVVSVRVTGIGGTSSTTTEARYTYLAPPTVRTVTGTSHATGPTAGGNTVTITGVGFTGITRVSFGSTAATAIRTLSTTRLTVVAPRRPAGTVNVQLTGTYGRSALVVADRYTYVDRTAPAPVAAVAVSATGSTSLTLSWANPTDADFAGVTIRRAAGTAPPSSSMVGTLVVDTTGRVATFTDIDLNPETTYSYALFAHDRVPNLASPTSISATTAPIGDDAHAARPGS